MGKARLEKIKKRQDVLMMIEKEAKVVLTRDLQDSSKSKAIVTKLIVQGALMLLEDTVSVQCRQSDVAMVESCLSAAAAEYAKVIKEECGTAKTVKLAVNKQS